MNDTRILALINDLLAASAETTCVEFKENNFAPAVIGKYISALANAAALAERDSAYLLWGVRDSDHAIIGTRFEPDAAKHHGQPLSFWLAQRLNPDVAFRFQIVKHPQGRLVLLEIPAATTSPVEFNRTAYCRIGSATPRLSDYPDRQKALWTKLQPYLWESGIAAQFLTDDAVLARIDYGGLSVAATGFSRTGRRDRGDMCGSFRAASVCCDDGRRARPGVLSSRRVEVREWRTDEKQQPASTFRHRYAKCCTSVAGDPASASPATYQGGRSRASAIGLCAILGMRGQV